MKNGLIRLLNSLTSEDLENMVLDLYEFYYNFIAIGYPNNVDAKHIRTLADKLMEVYLEEITNLCVAIPPRHSKSSIVTLAFPLWLIFENPNLNILIVNAEANLSENFGIRLREYIKLFGSVFNVYLSDVKHSSTHIKFENDKGQLYKGSIRLVGASGSITGQDADYLILDDIYKGFEDITPTLLDKKINWFKTMILQRKEPQTKLLILHTRWATNDLQGYLKKTAKEKYSFLSFPAIKENGLPLWPERYSIEFLKNQLKEMGERLFSSIYQQKPLDETGSFFNIDKIIWHDEPINFHEVNIEAKVRSWDLAYSDESKGIARDYTVGVPMYRLDKNTYIITDFIYGQFGEDLKNQIVRTAKSDGTGTKILIETGTKGGASKFLYNEYSSYLKGYNTKQSEPVGAKVDRATPFKNAILDGKIHIAVMNDELRGELIKQLKAFPLGSTHDDIIDAMAYGYSELETKGGNVVASGGKRERYSLDNPRPTRQYRNRSNRNRRTNLI